LTLHDIKPVKSGGNCFDDIIETISQFYQRSYQMMYVESLRFGFNTEDPSKSLGANLQLDFMNRFQLVAKYHGYRLQITREHSFN
jgi:predicted amino acid dehydrogenase